MNYLLFSHCNNGFTNAPQCYVIYTLPVVFKLRIFRPVYSYILLDIYFQPDSRDNRLVLYYIVVSPLQNISAKY
jgi:hypothetical protein